MKFRDILGWAAIAGFAATYFAFGESWALKYMAVGMFVAGVGVLVTGRVDIGFGSGEDPPMRSVTGVTARMGGILFFVASYWLFFEVTP